MHAEEREEMSKVSGGPSLGSPRLPGPLTYSCPSPAPHFPSKHQPQVHGAFPSPACTPALRQLVPQRLGTLISGFTSRSVLLQSRHREGSTPYAEYGGWYKACKVSR